MTTATAQTETHSFLTWLEILTNANTEELVHLVLVKPRGSNLGDAAWAQLVARKGHHGADVAVSNERQARELEREIAEGRL